MSNAFIRLTFCACIFSSISISTTSANPSLQACEGRKDVFFVIDVSRTMSPLQFSMLKDSLLQSIINLNVGKGDSRMGVIAFSDKIVKEIPLKSSQAKLRRQIKTINQNGFRVNTTLGIHTMLKYFIEQYKIKGVPKIGVVILNENSIIPGEAIGEAFRAKNDGVTMFGVGVSKSFDAMELMGIATSDQHILSFDSASSFAMNLQQLTSKICEVLPVTTSTTSTTTVTTTTTTTTTPTPPSTTRVPPRISTMAPIAGPCDNCEMLSGVGYNPHPEDCDKFTQCYIGPNNTILAAYRTCPFGQYWDQDQLTCIQAPNVMCFKEKCTLPGLLSYPYGTLTNNRAYWKCNLGKSIAMCCPEGYIYRPYAGCIEHDGPTDPCPPPVYHEGPCDSRPIFGDLGHYEQFAPGHGWIKMPCAPGTHYNPSDCGCTFHTSYIPGQKECTPEVFINFNNDTNDHSGNNNAIQNYGVQIDGTGYGYFDGNSKLVIPRFSNFETYTDFVIKLGFFHTPSDSLEALVSNGDDCCDHVPSVALVKSRQNLHYMAKCDDDIVSTFHMYSRPGNWNEAYYIHDGYKLEGRSNGLIEDEWAVGELQRSKAGLQIGHGRLFQNFTGYMDYVAVYLCRPSYL